MVSRTALAHMLRADAAADVSGSKTRGPAPDQFPDGQARPRRDHDATARTTAPVTRTAQPKTDQARLTALTVAADRPPDVRTSGPEQALCRQVRLRQDQAAQ